MNCTKNIKKIEGGVCAAKGFVASGVHCGIRKNKTKRDLALIYTEKKAAAACVYTQNLVKEGSPYETSFVLERIVVFEDIHVALGAGNVVFENIDTLVCNV